MTVVQIKEAPPCAADLEYRIAKLQLAPGDVLVAKVTGHSFSKELIDHIRQHFVDQTRKAGVSIKLLLIDDSIDLSVLTKADIEQRAGKP